VLPACGARSAIVVPGQLYQRIGSGRHPRWRFFTSRFRPTPLARKLDWMRRAPARELRRMDALLKASAEYPKSDRLVLPTRLGNSLRAREVPVHGASAGRLESFVHRVFDELPVALQTEHDQFRSRLDLYCSLVLVFVIGGAAGAALLAGVGATPAAAFAGAAAVLAWVSYRAAVASARAYGGLLKTIADVSASR
jgi:hypothetical protein